MAACSSQNKCAYSFLKRCDALYCGNNNIDDPMDDAMFVYFSEMLPAMLSVMDALPSFPPSQYDSLENAIAKSKVKAQSWQIPDEQLESAISMFGCDFLRLEQKRRRFSQNVYIHIRDVMGNPGLADRVATLEAKLLMFRALFVFDPVSMVCYLKCQSKDPNQTIRVKKASNNEQSAEDRAIELEVCVWHVSYD